MSEMTVERAIKVFALHAVASWAEDYDEDGDWETYPVIGEHDWNDVVAAVQAAHPFPSTAEFDEACAVLAARASAEDTEGLPCELADALNAFDADPAPTTEAACPTCGFNRKQKYIEGERDLVRCPDPFHEAACPTPLSHAFIDPCPSCGSDKAEEGER